MRNVVFLFLWVCWQADGRVRPMERVCGWRSPRGFMSQEFEAKYNKDQPKQSLP